MSLEMQRVRHCGYGLKEIGAIWRSQLVMF